MIETTKWTESGRPICNICREEDELDNLLTPCGCRGSLGHVHFKCIKVWIETSGNDICGLCKRTCNNGLRITKSPGRFGVFFYHSEMGQIYSRFVFFFLVLFYMSYLGQFHCRLAYHKGWISFAVMITVLNSFYLFVHTIIFLGYLFMIYLSFVYWRKSHFHIVVYNKDSE